jgi:hypothetical protein
VLQEPVTLEVTEQPAPVAELELEELDGDEALELELGGVDGEELGEELGPVLGLELGDVGPEPGVVVYATCV